MLQVELAETGTTIGRMDLSYATYLQVYELLLPGERVAEVLRQGVRIKQISGKQAVGVFGSDDARISEVFRPHLLLHNNERPSLATARAMLLNGDAFQSFGWMEGVALDGLHALSKDESGVAISLQKRFNQFFTDSSFSYLGANNTPVANRIASVETMLPFAVFAQYNPSHPALENAIAFCREHQNKDGVITGNPEALQPAVKTEECYTVAYPLTVIGEQWKDSALLDLAVKNLMARTAALTDSTGIWQRVNNKGEREFRNWSRGVAWYLLGFIRSWQHLQTHPQANELKKEFQRAAAYVMRFQNTNGLWACFMHGPETGEETSGSAGIAAALKYGYQLAVLDKTADAAAAKATVALQKCITPDGLLTGTSQANKGGEELQRSGLRVISPYTLGLLAFLMEGVKEEK